MLKRIIMVLTVMAIVAVMLATDASPALAKKYTCPDCVFLPVVPDDKETCKDGGFFFTYGYRSQGQCVSDANHNDGGEGEVPF
jgi:hypothetical protein